MSLIPASSISISHDTAAEYYFAELEKSKTQNFKSRKSLFLSPSRWPFTVQQWPFIVNDKIRKFGNGFLPVSPLTRLLLVFAIFNPISVTYASNMHAPTIKMITIAIIEILYPSSSMIVNQNL